MVLGTLVCVCVLGLYFLAGIEIVLRCLCPWRDALCCRGLDIRMDVTTGSKLARLIPTGNASSSSAYEDDIPEHGDEHVTQQQPQSTLPKQAGVTEDNRSSNHDAVACTTLQETQGNVEGRTSSEEKSRALENTEITTDVRADSSRSGNSQDAAPVALALPASASATPSQLSSARVSEQVSSAKESRRSMCTSIKGATIGVRRTVCVMQHGMGMGMGKGRRGLCTRSRDSEGVQEALDKEHPDQQSGEEGESESQVRPEYVPRVPVDDYDYDLPNERIAKYPVTPRDSSRLLFCGPQRNSVIGSSSSGSAAAFSDNSDWVLQDLMFTDSPSVIPKGSLVVFNESKVIPARIHMVKPTGGRVEVRKNERMPFLSHMPSTCYVNAHMFLPEENETTILVHLDFTSMP
jgi:hypothetical protein